MKGSAALFSTKKNSKNVTARDDWETPLDFFGSFCETYGRPDLDVCADAENTKCKNYYDGSKDYDGLFVAWDKIWWCNPPYSEIKAWVRKACKAEAPGTMLVPARTETDWWWTAVSSSTLVMIAFLKPRLSFELSPKKEKVVLRAMNKKRAERGLKPVDKLPGSTFPSALLFFQPDKVNTPIIEWWNWVTKDRFSI